MTERIKNIFRWERLIFAWALEAVVSIFIVTVAFHLMNMPSWWTVFGGGFLILLVLVFWVLQATRAYDWYETKQEEKKNGKQGGSNSGVRGSAVDGDSGSVRMH